MFLHISDVKYAGKYTVCVTFDNGVVKVVDLESELTGPVFEPLRDPALFRQVAVNADTGTVEWPNGADFAPEFLYEAGTPTEERALMKVAEERGVYGRRKAKPPAQT